MVYDIQSDQIGTPRMVTDQIGNAVWLLDNAEPFGNNVPNQSPNGTGSQFVFNLRFSGQYFDPETGLFQNYFRDYDPATGRFPESDPIGLNGGQFSTYAYVGGNPIQCRGPMGLVATVVVEGNNVTITIPITYSGAGATAQVTQSWNNATQNTWPGRFGDYNVTTTVTNGADNQISVPAGDGRAFVNGIGGNSGVWPGDRPGWTAAHEAGHLMGLAHHYTDAGGALPGWENDIMAARDRLPSARDIADIISANPSRRPDHQRGPGGSLCR